MASTSPEPGTIIYIKYITYELHRKLALSSKNIDCVNSLETSRRDASKECSQFRFNMVKQVANNVPGIGIYTGIWQPR